MSFFVGSEAVGESLDSSCPSGRSRKGQGRRERRGSGQAFASLLLTICAGAFSLQGMGASGESLLTPEVVERGPEREVVRTARGVALKFAHSWPFATLRSQLALCHIAFPVGPLVKLRCTLDVVVTVCPGGFVTLWTSSLSVMLNHLSTL